MPRCDQCQSATINGVYCHETGCYNQGRVYDEYEEKWMLPEPEFDEDDMEFIGYDPEED
jgi:hypothetical protein